MGKFPNCDDSNGTYWPVSPFNVTSDVLAQMQLPRSRSIYVADSTLRLLLGKLDRNLTNEDALTIAQALDDAGVELVFIDYWNWRTGKDPRSARVFEAIAAQDFHFTLTAVIPASEEALHEAMSSGAKSVSVDSGPDGTMVDFQHEYEVLSAASEHGLWAAGAIWILPDQAGIEHSIEHLNGIILANGKQISVYDVTSALTAEGLHQLLRTFIKAEVIGTPFTPHIRNYAGLATSIALSAVTAGVRSLDLASAPVAAATRMAAMEDAAVTLANCYGIRTGIDVNQLQELASVVSRVSGLPLPLDSVVATPSPLRLLT